MSRELHESIKPFYVYCLVDSRDESVFYVGKGSGRRIEQHKIESSLDGESEKLTRIRDIEATGGEVRELVVGRYDTAQEAFAVESTLIKWIYGFGNLTNAVMGHRHSFIRKKGNHEIIEGLDVPAKTLKNTGEYTSNVQMLNEQHDIPAKLSSLKASLGSLLKDRIELDLSVADNPSLYISNENFRIQLILRHSSRDKVVLNVRSKSSSRRDHQAFLKFAEQLNVSIKKPADPYFKVPGVPKKVSIHDPDRLASVVSQMIAFCEKRDVS